jgi:cell division protease FtsH
LHGPPGTGKTLLARATAGEASAVFFSIAASELIEIYAGTGALRIRQLFAKARKCQPSIIFIDEIDSIGSKSENSLQSSHQERDSTLNQLLTEMDGFRGNENIVVIAATNRLKILDTALIRSGRFDLKLEI